MQTASPPLQLPNPPRLGDQSSPAAPPVASKKTSNRPASPASSPDTCVDVVRWNLGPNFVEKLHPCRSGSNSECDCATSSCAAMACFSCSLAAAGNDACIVFSCWTPCSSAALKNPSMNKGCLRCAPRANTHLCIFFECSRPCGLL
jgi:hypothetical protein